MSRFSSDRRAYYTAASRMTSKSVLLMLPVAATTILTLPVAATTLLTLPVSASTLLMLLVAATTLVRIQSPRH
jgi:hypothetical protein